MNIPRVGIVGGAGPMAAALLFQKIIACCQENYGCQLDKDFPFILLLSYPFEDMLGKAPKVSLVKSQLEACLQQLIDNQVNIAAVACNTLHAFLDAEPKNIMFVDMIKATGIAIKKLRLSKAVILCSSTSYKRRLHNNVFQCTYLEKPFQIYTEKLIKKILKGKQTATDAKSLAEKLNALESKSTENVGLILGCTEFSVLNEQFPLLLNGLEKRFVILDPNQITAKEVCSLVFK